jgi:hypothetical protein
VNQICELPSETMTVDMKGELIQALIPIGLWDVKKPLEEAAGGRSRAISRSVASAGRWIAGHNGRGKLGGSACLLGQKLPIWVPRVRDQ